MPETQRTITFGNPSDVGSTPVIISPPIPHIKTIRLVDEALRDTFVKNFGANLEEHWNKDAKNPVHSLDDALEIAGKVTRAPKPEDLAPTAVKLKIQVSDDENGREIYDTLAPLDVGLMTRSGAKGNIKWVVSNQTIEVPYNLIDQALKQIGLSKQEAQPIIDQAQSIMGRG